MTELEKLAVDWKIEDMRNSLDDFFQLYQKRPIVDNEGGMRAPHMFATYFILKKINPSIIVESGIWRGQSTWLLENTCPNAQIYSFDVNLSYRTYTSEKAHYQQSDFSEYDWSKVDLSNALIFFDDHQNAYNRAVLSHWFGFKHIIYEDNFYPDTGDCYTFKHIMNSAGYCPPTDNWINKTEKLTQRAIRKFCGFINLAPVATTPQFHKAIVPKNNYDKNNLLKRIEKYYEFPPIFKPKKNSQGGNWNHDKFPVPKAILTDDMKDKYQKFYEEAGCYHWICYLKMK